MQGINAYKAMGKVGREGQTALSGFEKPGVPI